jgi:hypothetical protein
MLALKTQNGPEVLLSMPQVCNGLITDDCPVRAGGFFLGAGALPKERWRSNAARTGPRRSQMGPSALGRPNASLPGIDMRRALHLGG